MPERRGVRLSPWPPPSLHTPTSNQGMIVDLYRSACGRSEAAVGERGSLDRVAAVASFGRGPVNLRWILVYMIDETAHDVGHLDLLRDALSSS